MPRATLALALVVVLCSPGPATAAKFKTAGTTVHIRAAGSGRLGAGDGGRFSGRQSRLTGPGPASSASGPTGPSASARLLLFRTDFSQRASRAVPSATLSLYLLNATRIVSDSRQHGEWHRRRSFIRRGR